MLNSGQIKFSGAGARAEFFARRRTAVHHPAKPLTRQIQQLKNTWACNFPAQ